MNGLVVAQVDIVPREERCDDGPRPQPMPSMPVPGMGYWQQQQQPPPQQQQQQQPPMQAGPGDQHMGLPQQRQPGMQMDPAMMQAYYMVRAPTPSPLCTFPQLCPSKCVLQQLMPCEERMFVYEGTEDLL